MIKEEVSIFTEEDLTNIQKQMGNEVSMDQRAREMILAFGNEFINNILHKSFQLAAI